MTNNWSLFLLGVNFLFFQVTCASRHQRQNGPDARHLMEKTLKLLKDDLTMAIILVLSRILKTSSMLLEVGIILIPNLGNVRISEMKKVQSQF